MAYELVEKKHRGQSGVERVTISKSGRQFLISSAAIERYFGTAKHALIYVDAESSEDSVRVAIRPIAKAESDSYSIVRPRRSKSGYITARAALSKIGYKNGQSYARDVEWVERNIGSRKVHVLEFEIDRKFCKQ